MKVSTQRHTETDDHRLEVVNAPQKRPRLVRVFRADAPGERAEEFSLAGHDRWILGRADAGSPPPSGAYILTRDDRHMSKRHALVERDAEGEWTVADAESKNGAVLRGELLEKGRPRRLREGDVLECGSSFFVFRDACEPRVVAGLLPDATLARAPLHAQIAGILPHARSDQSLHLFGETGTGKDVVARAVHAHSGRRGAFVALNCAAIPEALFESELFGHVKGAFSGAASASPGHVREAANGTLFLDEIAELPAGMQGKLLRVLETKEVLPVGATKHARVDFRLISATHVDLRDAVARGQFRADLYARLGRTYPLSPLRDRPEDLGLLIPLFLTENKHPAPVTLSRVAFSLPAARILFRHRWPFNIRELKSCVDAALTAARAEAAGEAVTIDLSHLPAEISAPRPRRVSSSETPEPRTALAAEPLLRPGETVREAAERAGVSQRQLYRRLRARRET